MRFIGGPTSRLLAVQPVAIVQRFVASTVDTGDLGGPLISLFKGAAGGQQGAQPDWPLRAQASPEAWLVETLPLRGAVPARQIWCAHSAPLEPSLQQRE